MLSPLAVSASTNVVGLIGHPARHSLSPVIHNAAFAAVGLDWVFVAFETQSGREAVEACRALGLKGLSVTMPHKDVAAATVNELSPHAAKLNAVNCISRNGEVLIGHNTDGAGFLESVRTEASFEPVGRRCVVLGAGGAARAVILALADAGADEIVVVNRTPASAEAAVALAPKVAKLGAAESVAQADLVVNATSVGMAHPTDPEAQARTPVDVALFSRGQVVVDLIYHPATTALMAGAAKRGATVVGGLGMLVHQAALAFTIWTGEPAPVAAMFDAAIRALNPGAGGVV